MPRYTDTDELLEAMDTWDKFGFSHSGAFVREPKNDDYVPYVHYDDMVKCVKGMPTADVRENVYAKWEDRYKDGDWHCTNCGAIIEKDEQIRHMWNYCYHCGAIMWRSKK